MPQRTPRPPQVARLVTVVVLAPAMVLALVPPARADEADGVARPGERPTDVWARVTGESASAPAPTGSVGPAASSEESGAVARLNAYRARSGLRPLSLVGAPGAVVSHARYLDANFSVTGLDPFSEDPSLPGYTAAGAAIAPQTWPGASSTGTYSQIVDEWLADPEAQYFLLLAPGATTISFTRQGRVVLAWTQSGADPGTYPIVFPQGPNFNLIGMPAGLGSYYGQNCSGAVAGFPITFQFDPALYDRMYVNSSNVRVDGTSVAVCPVNNVQPLATAGMVVLIPSIALPRGSQVTSSVTATAYLRDGSGSRVVQASTVFTVQAPVTATPGDQTGDKTADILAVTTTGDLMLYKGRQPGTIGHGFQIGRGWNQFTWFAHTPDVNGDHREDLIGRRADGHLYLYYGQGMGSYTAGKKVGQNWGALRNLTVVGDMNADGTPEVIGIGPEGNLYRYTLTANGFIGASLIGKNWQGIELTASVGSFNATTDPYADLIAVGTNGRLYAYYTGKNGTFIQAAVIGQGWTGFTALFSPGDLTGDNRPDLIGRNQTGTLYSYQNRSGSWGPARQAGTNWNDIRLFG
ncbi:VCBS repeat-containing protein [Tessaracoccus sp. SD287]|uniref:VCBS repeat-containing protein n=1 Tax=Tessaracoccus sp. SD287 TaxID=2782008 RepID=UPI001A978B9B|nr:VCBS repeat-containing protein [Tessaracoccus sp. SD287]MBO1030292.1 VCBS repeat-containing protein [Tessaracoccus sp. SD287]